MRFPRRVIGALALIVSALAFTAASATASSLPKLLSGQNGGPYRVRPHRVGLEVFQCCGIEKGQDLDFGTLTLHWSKWTTTKAVGSGVSVDANVTPPDREHVSVTASRVHHGRFTRLVVNYRGKPKDRLVLTLLHRGIWSDAVVADDD